MHWLLLDLDFSLASPARIGLVEIMRVRGYTKHASGSTSYRISPPTASEEKRDEQVEQVENVIRDFLELDGDFEVELPELGPEIVDRVKGTVQGQE